MTEVLSTFNIESILNGAILEEFEHQFAQVIQNIADLNNDAKAKRKVQITFEIKPNPQRDYATVDIKVSSSCNPHTKPMESACLINRRADQITVTERYVEQTQLEVA